MLRPRHTGKHFSQRTLKIHRFFLSFSLSALALTAALSTTLGLGGLWAFSRSPGSQPPDTVMAAQTTDDVPVTHPALSSARAEDGLTVLVMGVKDRESVSNTCLLLRFDPLKGRIPVTSLPPQTMVTKPQGDKTPLTLSETYRFGGHALTVQALENTLGFPIDRYVVVDTAAFLEIGQMAGPVQYDLGQTLDYRDAERSIRLAKGTQLVDGQKAIDIVTYPKYPGKEPARAEMTASLAVEIINRKLSLAACAGADQLFKSVINRLETNITFLDFEERRTLAAAMESLSPAFQIYPDGVYDAAGESYVLTEDSLRMLRAYFGR